MTNPTVYEWLVRLRPKLAGSDSSLDVVVIVETTRYDRREAHKEALATRNIPENWRVVESEYA